MMNLFIAFSFFVSKLHCAADIISPSGPFPPRGILFYILHGQALAIKMNAIDTGVYLRDPRDPPPPPELLPEDLVAPPPPPDEPPEGDTEREGAE